MKIIELESVEEFEDVDTYSSSQFLKILNDKYPNVIKVMLDDYQELYKDYYGSNLSSKYSVEELFEIYGEDDLIDYFDEYYVSVTGSSDGVILNYIVRDSVGTDKGTWDMVVCNGYMFDSVLV